MVADVQLSPTHSGPQVRVRWASVLLVILATIACGPAPAVLDKAAQLERFQWWDNRDFDWYARSIPFLETPDPEIDATYYYRWEVVTKHLVYGSPEHGYAFTEFLDRPFWSGAYGAISCPLGHQFHEIRWLKAPRIVQDYARYWFEVPGAEPRSYSNWYGESMWALYQVSGDLGLLESVLPYMQRQYEGWLREHWDPDQQLFRWDGMHDGMESNIDSRQTAQWFDGAEGYRPTLNSYLYADALAIAKAAARVGDEALADRYAARAAALREQVLQQLWDPDREFFLHRFARDERAVRVPWPWDTSQAKADPGRRRALEAVTHPGESIRAGSRTYQTGPWAGSSHGREEIGFVPWQFDLPKPGTEQAWRFLMDPRYFYAPFGPTTTEREDPLYYVSPRCCVWSGNSWPYATAQTLTALANLLNDYEQDVIGRDAYFKLLRNYALTQRKRGRPYIAEAADPDTGSWAGHDKYFHSEHYFHSGFIDQVITGLVGLRPQDDDSVVINPLAPNSWDWFALEDVAYRGHRITVLWDRDGSRYQRGAGLQVRVDGSRAAARPDIGRLQIALRPVTLRPVPHPVNWAARNGKRWYPHASASSARPESPPDRAQDGQYWYHRSPPNRWVAAAGRDSDWYQVQFGAVRRIDTVKLYFLDDTTAPVDFVAEDAPSWLRGDREPTASGPELEAGNSARVPVPSPPRPVVVPPRSFQLLYRDHGEWMPVESQRREPREPAGRRANIVRFPAIEATAIRVVMQHRTGAVSGLSELETWGPAPEGPAPAPTAPVADLAYNAGAARLPRATASFSARGTEPARLLDGETAYNYYTHAGWSAQGSPNASDWVQIDLDGEHAIDGVDVYLWAWESRGTAAPRRMHVEVWNGARWTPVRQPRQTPPVPLALARNRIAFDPVRTDRVRVVFERGRAGAAAATEIVVWAAGAER